MLQRLVIILFIVISYAACAISTDPRQGGLLGGLQGIRTGAYDERIRQRQEELTQKRNINQELKEQSKELDRDVRARELVLASEKKRLTEMEKELLNLQSSINRLNAESKKQKSEITAINCKIARYRQRLKSQQSALDALNKTGEHNVDPRRYQILKQERERLNEEYRRLLKYSQALSNATH